MYEICPAQSRTYHQDEDTDKASHWVSDVLSGAAPDVAGG